MTGSTAPRISCIVTAYNEGPLAAVAVESLLAQTFGDFELLLVDDGASEETRETLHAFRDPRIRHLRQANDGLSSARNRAIANATGDYLCFLDADDSRPSWAFAEMARAAVTEPDCVFSPGLLCEVRNEVHPFYDDAVFWRMQERGLGEMSEEADPVGRMLLALRHLACLEPQSANKMVRRAFAEKHALKFPSGLFFEDMIYHVGILMNLRSFALTELPTFTYFRRYGRPQLTSSASTIRFDAISMAGSLLQMMPQSRLCQDTVFRTLVLASLFKLLKWCEESTSHSLRHDYRQALLAMVLRLDPVFFAPMEQGTLKFYEQFGPWVVPSLVFAASLRPRPGEAQYPNVS